MSQTGKYAAEDLAKKQKSISVSEFFERNKHILGFDSATRALITSVKEAVDNALDACEEAGILPDIHVEIRKENPNDKGNQEIEYALIVEDNGPGIVKRQIPNIFARLLYGSRFHSIRQNRGQQGIGISATVMYGQLTTGKPAIVASKIGDGQPVNVVHLKLDTRQNKPEVVKSGVDSWPDKAHGTRFQANLVGKYQRGQQSIFEYLRGTAIVNPHAEITFIEPDGTTTVFERATDKIPEATKEIKPHPEGIELGQFMKMAKDSAQRSMTAFLNQEFSRVTTAKAREICKAAAKRLGEDAKKVEALKPQKVEVEHARAFLNAVKDVKLMAPPTDCLSPIGEVLVKKGLRKEMPDVEFVATITRPAAVYSGRPFQVEVGIAYGGGLPKDEQVKIARFANRVPLMYQKGGCVSAKAVESIDWRRYELEQRGGRGIPIGPAVILVHVASVNVPFTSEAKEAIADIDVIHQEVKRALQECGRRLGSHVRKKAKLARMKEKEAIIRKIIPKIAEKSAGILGKPVPDYEPVIARIMNNVMLNEEISYHAGHKRHTVKVTATNYTLTRKAFDLVSVLPHDVEVVDVDPKPSQMENGMLRWRVKNLQSTEKRDFKCVLKGLDESDFTETDLYVKGIDEQMVIGAEAWKEDVTEEAIERMRTVVPGPSASDAEGDGSGDDDAEDAVEPDVLGDDANGKKPALDEDDEFLRADTRPRANGPVAAGPRRTGKKAAKRGATGKGGR